MSKSYHCFLPTLLCLLTLAFSAEKRIYTTQKTAVPPKLDGVFNETCWNLVEWSGGFTQHSPDDGAAPSQETAFKILYDHRYLYIAYRAFDNEPDLISKRLSRRDHFEGDWVEINIDSYFDQRTAFSFTASVSGAKGDEFISEDGNSWDGNWDPIWDFEAVTDSLGWSAEVRIPLSQLRFGSKEEHVWGIQLTRRIFRLEERSTWQYTPRDETGWVSNFGELHGINGIKAQKQIEILPYMVTQLEDYKPETENPFAPGRELASKYGLDGKIGITSDMTLDLTINPDFGQVEADPSQVNLSAFETYFQEKRPFFIEGRNIFDYQVTSAAWGGDYSSDNLFYSRRIGRPPQWYPDPDSNHEDDTWEHIRIPDNTRILGAFKLSGKTKDGLSIGMLESMTAREFGEIDSLGQRQHPTVEPQTNYFVGRLQKDYDNGNTILGGILTTTNRFGIKDKPFDALLHRQAYTGGLDLFHRWMDNTYYISANAIFSQVNGSEEAILNTQLAPARYYQRPDICHVSVDSSRTSLSGHGGTLKFGKSSGRRIEYETGVTWRSPGLELNDMGYLQKADQINHWTWIGLRFREPRGIFNEIGLNFNESMHWDYAGKKVHNKMNINGHLNFKNLWNASGGVTLETDPWYRDALRGGPYMRFPGGAGYNMNLHSPNRGKISSGMGAFMWKSFEDHALFSNVWFYVDLRPTNSLLIAVNPEFNSGRDKLQWVGKPDYDGGRYLSSSIHTKHVNISMRINYTVSPELTIEFYGSPFVATGKYSDFKLIVDPGADKLEDRYEEFHDASVLYNQYNNEFGFDETGDGLPEYSIYNPDYNYRAFNSNLVIRWEFSPGSTLYLVWSQARSSFESLGTMHYRSDVDQLFATYPHNVFLLKFNYLFNL